MSVMIVNDGAQLETEDSVRFLLQSIFPPRLGLQDALRPLESLLCSRISTLRTLDGALSFIRDTLYDPEQSTWLEETFRLQVMEALDAHVESTFSNRMAYVPHRGLENPDAIFWPNPTRQNSARDLYDTLPFARRYPIIGRDTPVGSAGSCFATEIAHRLQRAGYHYVITERNRYMGREDSSALTDACAAWGIIFNIPALHQLVEKAFGLVQLPKLLYLEREGGQEVYCDPFREGVRFDSPAQFEENWETHLEACREALLKVRVFVMTLGINEVWYLRGTGHVLSRTPWRLSSTMIEHRTLGVQENVTLLNSMLKTWRSFNPHLQLIVSVSPVPLNATFRAHDTHVVTATCCTKSTMRVVAEEFVNQNEGVYYLPSFDTVMYTCRDLWTSDQRHISPEAIDKVMLLFRKMFQVEPV